MYQNFEELKKYFLNLPSTDVLAKSNNHSFIYLDWIFTDLINRDVIEQAITNIIQKEYKDYRPIGKIEGFEVIRNKGRLLFKARASTEKYKINITDDESLIEEDNGKGIISFTELRDEIRNVLGNKDLDEANSKLILVGMEKAFDDACGNLLRYYKYLLDEREKHSNRECIINQRNDTTTHGESIEPQGNLPRINELIDFEERKRFLQSMNPTLRVDTNEKDKNGNLYPAYSVYMYKGNLLKNSANTKDGYLFIAEPVKGDRGTRIFYLSEQEFEEYVVEQGEDKVTYIVKQHLEMSKKEFSSKEKGTCMLSHTDMKTYKERLAFYKDATKGDSLTWLKKYRERISKLYGEDIILPYYKGRTVEDIKKMTRDVPKIDQTYNGKLKNAKETKDDN